MTVEAVTQLILHSGWTTEQLEDLISELDAILDLSIEPAS